MGRYVLIGIILLGLLLRIIGISDHPVGFNADEASFGYDAYSILKTGNDQWGNTLPLVLKSFGDFKSPLYAYLAIPFILVFDLNKFAVRAPNALISTLAIYVIYLLARQLGELTSLDKKRKTIFQLSSSFLLAVSPWHIMMSRGVFEANLITFFLPAGIYFFLKGIKNSKFLVISAVFFGLSLFTYHSAKLIAPLVFLGLVIIFRKKLIKLKFKMLFVSLVVFLIFFFGLLYTFTLGGGSRISERSITQGAIEEGAKTKIALINSGEDPVITKILHNKYQVIAQRFISNYQQYFSLKFLFQKGAGDTSYGMIPYGVIYVFEGVLLFGTIYLFFRKNVRTILFFIIVWLLIAPFPAALATGVGYSGNRAEGMIPVMQILVAFGIIGWSYVLKSVGKKLMICIVFLFFVFGTFEIGKFVSYYFQKGTNIASKGMLYGSLESAYWLSDNKQSLSLRDKNVIIGRELSEPQIFVAFANKWDPTDYQNATKNWDLVNGWVDQQGEYKLGQYTFRSINYKTDSKLTNTILVGSPESFPESGKLNHIIYYPNGNPVYVITINQ